MLVEKCLIFLLVGNGPFLSRGTVSFALAFIWSTAFRRRSLALQQAGRRKAPEQIAALWCFDYGVFTGGELEALPWLRFITLPLLYASVSTRPISPSSSAFSFFQ
jgi:hypothetical protein